MKHTNILPPLTVGTKFKVSGPANMSGTFEVRSLVDKEYVVVKSWAARKRRYTYEINHKSWFEILYETGRLTFKK